MREISDECMSREMEREREREKGKGSGRVSGSLSPFAHFPQAIQRARDETGAHAEKFTER